MARASQLGPVTRVVVDGQVIESDGKTENAQHVLALDPVTVAVLPEIDPYGVRHSYATADLEADRQVAKTIASPRCTNPCTNGKRKAPSMIGRGL